MLFIHGLPFFYKNNSSYKDCTIFNQIYYKIPIKCYMIHRYWEAGKSGVWSLKFEVCGLKFVVWSLWFYFLTSTDYQLPTTNIYLLPSTILLFPFYRHWGFYGFLLGVDWVFRGSGPNEPPTNPQPTPNLCLINDECFQEKNRMDLVDQLILYRNVSSLCWLIGELVNWCHCWLPVPANLPFTF